MTDLAAAHAHCAAELRAERYDDWLAALFAPADLRPRLHALGAFSLELARVRERTRQPAAGEIRLQWWQEVVDGARESEAAAHPVAAALRHTINAVALPAAPFGDLIDAHRATLYDGPSVDLAAAERRWSALLGIPIRLAGLALGGNGAALAPAAEDSGIALGIAEALLHPMGPAVPHTAGDLVDVARARLASLRGRRGALGAAVGPAFLTTALVASRIRRATRAGDGGAPATDLPLWRRQAIMWFAARAWR